MSEQGEILNQVNAIVLQITECNVTDWTVSVIIATNRTCRASQLSLSITGLKTVITVRAISAYVEADYLPSEMEKEILDSLISLADYIYSKNPWLWEKCLKESVDVLYNYSTNRQFLIFAITEAIATYVIENEKE